MGRLVIDERNHTSVRNVFAAGDIVPGPQLAIVAAVRGDVATVAIHASLGCPRRESFRRHSRHLGIYKTESRAVSLAAG
jgi:pyruvate/2-oxoglutarate dehydrogenase complex dihydrolipoamide dehydrogenase (E3) component